VDLVYDSKGSTSFISVDGYAEENRTKFNCNVLIGKSDAEVTNKKTALKVLYC